MNDPSRDTRGPVIHDPFVQTAAAPARPRTPWLAIVAVTSTALFVAATVAAVWLWRSRPAAAPPSVDEPPAALAPVPSLPVEPDPPLTAAPSPQPSAPPSASTAPAPLPSGVPQANVISQRGTITVVDIGVSSDRPLTDELAVQRAAAQAAGQTVLLMMTRFGNKLFLDFDAALPHPLMQSALANVRLVRLDGRYFIPDLEEMGIPTSSFPWFFTLGPDLTPRDGINGGEWGDDIPRNIAPVLGAFVKGTYKTRREPWTPPRGKGVQL